ncbi:MAG: gas vesicle protein GvpR [Dethiobacter sp.]|jgi:hypothetical protein|nr:MAG: gas vesicle protein GvpR [Dethiobacter sp.]
MSTLEQVLSKVVTFFDDIYHREAHVLEVSPEGNGWHIKVEIIEEDEYMRKRAKRDLLGVYDVILNQDFEVISFERKELKERGTL